MIEGEEWLQRREDSSLDELLDLLTIPSVSALPEHADDVQRAAAWAASRLEEAGLEHVQVMQTAGHPIVYGDWLHALAGPTVLVYGHVDVQPVDPIDLWTTPPFEPQIREDRVYARGASDMKGNVLASILGVEALLRTEGVLPVNLKVLLEAEEEIGSPSIPAFITAHRDLLACDVVASADGLQWSESRGQVVVGLRGVACVQIDVRGPAGDLHSGVYGGTIANPIHALAHLVDSMRGSDGSILVAGFYDDVVPLTPQDRASLAEAPFDEAALRRETGVRDLVGEEGFTPAERSSARPTLDVNGIWGGFQGAGVKTVIPSEAHAKITCRLVPDQRPDRITEALQAHVTAHTPRGVDVSVEPLAGSALPYLMPRDFWANRAAAATLADLYGVPPYYTRLGSTLPLAGTLLDLLGTYTVTLGFSLDDERFHAPDEFFRLSSFRGAQRGWATLLHRLGEMWPDSDGE